MSSKFFVFELIWVFVLFVLSNSVLSAKHGSKMRSHRVSYCLIKSNRKTGCGGCRSMHAIKNGFNKTRVAQRSRLSLTRRLPKISERHLSKTFQLLKYCHVNYTSKSTTRRGCNQNYSRQRNSSC